MSREVPITPEGLAAVKTELEELTSIRRPYIADKIKAARELGDLSENFEYHAAKNEQGFIEARINELDSIVKNAVIIDAKPVGDTIEVGTTVSFSEDGGPEETYRIVGPAEADPGQGRISYESAIGKAFLGHKPGDTVEVSTPTGSSYEVKITGIS